jgi:hypothetical protein
VGLSSDSMASAPMLVVRKQPVVTRASWLITSCMSLARPIEPWVWSPFHQVPLLLEMLLATERMALALLLLCLLCGCRRHGAVQRADRQVAGEARKRVSAQPEELK